MSSLYKGLAVPDYTDSSDAPLAFQQFIDSGPIPRFANATARNAAITAPIQGQVIYRLDTKVIEIYDATPPAAWKSVNPLIPPAHSHGNSQIQSGIDGAKLLNDSVPVSGASNKLKGVIESANLPNTILYKNNASEQLLAGEIRLPNGQASVPSLQFGVQDAGFFRNPTGGAIGLAFANALHWEFDPAGSFGTASFSLDVANYDVPQIGMSRAQNRMVAVAADGQAGIFGRNTPGGALDFRLDGVQKGTISVSTSGVTYGSQSDERLKDQIADLSPEEANEKVMGLRPRTFVWREDQSRSIGLIAQEVQEVYDEPLNIPADPEEFWMLDYAKFVTIILKQVQELTERVGALEGV